MYHVTKQDWEYMFFTVLFLTIYIFMTVFAAAMTLIEQKSKGMSGFIPRSMGLFACAVWPVTFAAIVVAVLISRLTTTITSTT